MEALRILVVEDDLGDRKLLRRLITRALPEAVLTELGDTESLVPQDSAPPFAPVPPAGLPPASLPTASLPAPPPFAPSSVRPLAGSAAAAAVGSAPPEDGAAPWPRTVALAAGPGSATGSGARSGLGAVMGWVAQPHAPPSRPTAPTAPPVLPDRPPAGAVGTGTAAPPPASGASAAAQAGSSPGAGQPAGPIPGAAADPSTDALPEPLPEPLPAPSPGTPIAGPGICDTDDGFDLILLDHMLPGRHGLDRIAMLTGRWPRAAIVLMTGQGSEELATAAIQRGAVDYVAKRALTEEALIRIARRGVETARLRWRIEQQRRELERFCEVLVHDFRAPIRAVGFLAETLIEDIGTADRATIAKSAALLVKSARQMSDLVQSLATHIRLDRDDAEMRRAPLAGVVEAALTALQREIAESGAAIAIETAGIALPCDPPALAQVLQNLIANAIKYAADAPPAVRIWARTEGATVLVGVEDEGLGVPAAQAERIFEPFVRLGTTKARPGTGLGLATCRRVVQRHGGMIWCAPREGGGTIFYIRLPAAPVVGQETAAE
ncbi:sensor histidine kinase [Frigidibacter sp. MR17.24]|uniref:sensor histidine kinase n=1 Tax=Frigidibacter sp. MR17.24 TaxID=3127345 RepID=UPI003012DFA4